MVQLANDVTNRIEQLVCTVGDGSGTTNMTHSDTDGIEYFVKPPSGYAYDITRINVHMQDNGKYAGEKYGASGALATGIVVAIKSAEDDSVIKTLTPLAIKTLGHWNLVCGIDMFITNFTTGNDLMAVRWTFAKGGGSLILRNGIEYLSFLCQDAMNDIVEHYAQVQGLRRAWPA